MISYLFKRMQKRMILMFYPYLMPKFYKDFNSSHDVNLDENFHREYCNSIQERGHNEKGEKMYQDKYL